MPKKITIDELAAMTQRGFRDLEKRMATKDDLKQFATKEAVRLLNENMREEFTAIRREIQEGTRAILAAIETVEYTKLRIRLDMLEERVEKVEHKTT